MGIRVSCPNGHSLNIKSFLAGKLGVCPKCDAKFRIPAGPADHPAARGPGAGRGIGGAGSSNPVLPAESGASAQTVAFDEALEDLLGGEAKQDVRMPSPAARFPALESPTGKRASAAVLSGAPRAATASPAENWTAGGASPPERPGRDPSPAFDDGQDAWFVSPPSGGQYGPADEATLRQWMAEGRINGPTMVWKAGWGDKWRRADEVFDELRASSGRPHPPTPTPAAPQTIPLPTPGAVKLDRAGGPGPTASPRRRGSQGGGALLVGFLALVSVLLVVALVVVLM